MAEVNFTNNPFTAIASRFLAPKERDSKKVQKQKTVFQSVLETAKESESESQISAIANQKNIENLEELMDAIHSSGDLLKDKPSIENIKQYKESVRGFLKYIVDNTFDIEEHMTGRNILKRKKHTLVQIVDQKLEQLAATILQGQKSQLEILKRLEEISGLLIDLMQ